MQQIGRYQIVNELGRGAMGVVYRAQDPAIGRTIAIKTIRLTDLTDPGERERLRERLFREAQSAGILSHPNIVTIYDILEEQGMAYIFMEFVNGPPLEKVLSAEHSPDRHTLIDILRQTASALDYAHRKGIVHRDIKPANIMIHDDGAAKVTDFGVAKIVSQQMTQSGTMMGTPSYMSPEQVQGGSVDGRADQFALAVMSYEMMTGEKPFVAEYLPSLLYKICREDPAPPQRLNTTLSAHVDAVIKRSLAKDPADRYATCTEFINDLERACNANPDWVPLPRGASHNMPTVVTTTAVPLLPPQASSAPVKTAAPKAPPPPPAPPPPMASPAAPAPVVSPPRPPARLDEEPANHTVRNVVLALAAIVVLALIVVIVQKWNSKPASAQGSNSETKDTPAGQKAEPEKPSPESAAKNADVYLNGPALSFADLRRAVGVIYEGRLVEAVKTRGVGFSPTPEELNELKGRGASESLISLIVSKAPTGKPTADSTPPAPSPSGKGKGMVEAPIHFASNPPGAKVIVDNKPELSCATPCQLPLGPGRHVLSAKLDGYRDAQRIFETPREADQSIQMDRLMGTLSVSSAPPGATILINGQAQPQKTPAVLSLPAGSYRLQVTRGNVKTDEETVQIRDGVLSQRKYTIE